jgi:hypothetical protein
MYFDRQGRPMGMLDWAAKIEDRDYCVVAQHWVRGWMVSTVWLGLNHNFTSQGPPIIFETMIFAPKDATIGKEDEGEDWEAGEDAFGTAARDLDQYQERYPTEAAAQAGHDRALAAMVDQLGADATADIAGPLVPGSSDSDWDGTLPDEAQEGDRPETPGRLSAN